MEANVETLRLGRLHLFGAGPAPATAVPRAREIAACAMGREAQSLGRIRPPHHQNRLRHVQRDQGQLAGILGISVPGGGRPLAVIELIAATEDEVVLVPEPRGRVSAQGFDDRLMQCIVIGIGPAADRLQGIPIVAPLIAVGRDPGILLQGLRHPGAVQEGIGAGEKPREGGAGAMAPGDQVSPGYGGLVGQ